MQMIVQLVVSGLAMGFLYCLVSLEFTLIIRASGLMNFGHDQYIMLGAYVFVAFLVTGLNLSIAPSIIIALVIMVVLGVVLAVLVLIPLRKVGTVYALVGTMTASMVVRELTRFFWHGNPFTIMGFVTGVFRFGSIVVSRIYPVTIIVAILILIAQTLMFRFTRLGKAMRAVSQDQTAAALMGINVNGSIAITVAMCIFLCGVIGVLFVPLFGVDMSMTGMIGAKGFVAAIVGGFGTIGGCVVGGIAVGILENLYLLIGPAIYKDAVSFALIIIFLFFRPQGLIRNRKSRDMI